MDLNNYVVQIRRGTKRITLQRFLCSKIAYGESFSEIELAAMFHNQLWLQTKCSTDVDFQSKFGRDLESLTKILKEVNFSRGLTERATESVKQKLKTQDWDFLYPQRNLPQIKLQVGNSVVTKWRKPEGVEVSRLPPEKHIGKGYRDHGTAKTPELDASPAWQEVASEVGRIDGALERLNLNDITEKDINDDPLRILGICEEALNLVESKKRIANSGNSRAAKATQRTRTKVR